MAHLSLITRTTLVVVAVGLLLFNVLLGKCFLFEPDSVLAHEGRVAVLVLEVVGRRRRGVVDDHVAGDGGQERRCVGWLLNYQWLHFPWSCLKTVKIHIIKCIRGRY